MKFVISLIFLFGMISLQAELFVLNTISQTISKIDPAFENVNNSFAMTGLYPNQMAVKDDFIYLTNSGDNNITKIDRETGMIISTIALEQYSNPFDIVIKEGYAYVTGFMTDKVYKIDLNTELIAEELSVGIAPQGLLIHENHLYVANSGFLYPDYLPGELTVIDLQSFRVETILSVPSNPQRMIIDNDGFLHLVCTGNYGNETGSIVIIDTSEHQITDTLSLTFFPSNIAKTPAGRVYVGDSFGQGVFVYETEGLNVIHGNDNLFSVGGSALAVYEDWLLVADAGTYTSNSVIRVYDFEEQLVSVFNTAIGAVDIAYASEQTTSVDETVIPSPGVSVFPNPFIGETRIRINSDASRQQGISESSQVTEENIVTIYNVKGQKVNILATGESSVVWNGYDSKGRVCAPGLYLIRIIDNRGNVQTGKITLIR